MREQIEELGAHVRGIWRFKWTLIAVAWCVLVAGFIAITIMPNRYESSAKIFVDTDSVLKPLLQGLAVNTDVMNQVNMMSRVLMSRPNLEKVARQTGLALRVSTPDEFERLIDSLPKRIGLNGGTSNIFSVTFQDSDPQMSFRVVKTLVDTFVESAIGVKRDDATGAQRFLQEQIKEYEQKLSDAESRLASFKKENIGLMPGQTGDYYQRRQLATDALDKLRSQLRLAEGRRDELRRQLQGEEPTFGIFTGGSKGAVSSPLDAKIADYQKQLDQLLLVYTDKHPKAVALQETIELLKKQKAQGIADQPAPIETDPARLAARSLDINPVYQNMKISLNQVELEIVELNSKIAQQQAQLGDLQSKVNTIPEVEAQLARLDRDYEVNRAQYQALLQRLESARLSEEAEGSREQIKFRVIQPAAVPLVPLSPNRPLLASIVLALALACGFGVARIRDQLQPVFTDRASIAAATGLPILGVISTVKTANNKDTHFAYHWYASLCGLVVLFLLFLAKSTQLASFLSAALR